MKNKWFLIGLFISITSLIQAQLPVLNQSFQTATVKTNKNLLIVSTGKVQRTWQWTGKGLATVSVKNLATGKEWKSDKKNLTEDWAYYGLIDKTEGKLISLTAKQEDDEHFTSSFLNITAEIEYPSVKTAIKYQIWVYPDATGLRTQLFIKGDGKQFFKNVSEEQTQIGFDLTKGKTTSDKPVQVVDDQTVELLVSNLNPSKKYVLGMRFSPTASPVLPQKIRASNIDREKKQVLIEATEGNTATVDIPSQLLTDGSLRVYADKIAGEKAVIAEIWLYEKGNAKPLNLTSLREKEVAQNAPQGSILKVFCDFSSINDVKKRIQYGRTDFLPISPVGMKRRNIGYYNDTQNRNTVETPLIKEEEITSTFDKTETCDWSSILCLENNTEGVMLVKESHKCVNQYGVETGDFEVSKTGIANRGTALLPHEITPDVYKWCWATWSILYKSGDANRQLALKEFDRIRYPIDPARDIYIQANTWGSGRDRAAAVETNVLKEIHQQAALGIDIQQVDDGWQDNKTWLPKKEAYPEGWKNIVALAEEKKVKLGLWGAAMPITLEALKESYDKGHFVSYKLDFAKLNTHQQVDDMVQKARQFIAYTNHKVRINWDVTENAARFGFYWAKEYGCIYLENRKPDKPLSVVYKPALVLRDIWHLAKYTNIHKFQTSIQNVDKINKTTSNAHLYTNAYAVAIGLIGTPLFFQETQNYTEGDVKTLQPILAAYKNHRKNIYDNYTFPIGNEPCDAAYTGFINYKVGNKTGYLFLFRELLNTEKEHDFDLKWLKNKDVVLTNILTNEKINARVDVNGILKITIDKHADFRIFKFDIL